MANALIAPSAIIGLMGAGRRRPSLLPFFGAPDQADAADEAMFAANPNGTARNQALAMALAQQQSPASGPQAPAQRERVSALNVLFRGLAPNLSGALDTERTRLQTEADRPAALAIAQENERIARALGPQALLALRTNGEALGEGLAAQYKPTTTAAGGVSTIFGTGQQIEAPRVLEFGNDLVQTGPISGTRTLATRGPSYAEEAQIARIEADQRQADARLNLDERRLEQDQGQFDARLGYDQSRQEARPLTRFQEKQVEEYYGDIDAIGSTNSEIDRIDNLIESGELNLGPVTNATSQALNALGISTPNSANFAEFQSTVQKLVNDSLRLNKGVQTEGDAQRAATEILRNPRDERVVRAQLRRLRELNERALRFRQGRLSELEGGSRGGAASSGPQVGTVEDGYRFKGGDPASPSSWEPVQ